MIKILMVGGGSGGHIVPVAAVIEQLHDLSAELEIRFWCDKKSLPLARQILSENRVAIQAIAAGKFRRYHHFRWWQHLRPSIMLPNLIDLFKISLGFVQSFWRLMRWRPDVVFAKGGFVCLPVGLVAHWLGIKLVIHDSDTVAGLTNRVLSRFASVIATGMPTEYYNYPQAKTVFVGSPTRIQPQIRLRQLAKLKQQLGLPADSANKIILVSGGGLGSDFLNNLVRTSLPQLSTEAFVVLLAGRANYRKVVDWKMSTDRVKVIDFTNQFTQYLAVADLVVARAGATTIAEIANYAKPVVLIPNPKLVEGHQLKNAQRLVECGAAMILDEFDLEQHPESFSRLLNKLLEDDVQLKGLSRAIACLARPQAARQLAQLLLEQVEERKDG